MAMLKEEFEFTNMTNVMDFVKPLILEGYSVVINTVYIHKDVPFEDSIDKFVVYVGEKGCKMAVYNPEEKACDDNG